jgi:phage terminase large subunit-like protein
VADALSLLGSLVLEDGRRWGDVATPWQWDDARAVLTPGAGPTKVFLTRPRGASKTADLGAMVLVAMLCQLPAHARCYGFANDAEQVALMLESIDGFLRNTPGLRTEAKVVGNTVICRNGSTYVAKAAEDAGTWGLRPHFVTVDELAQWPDTRTMRRLWTAIVSSMPKVAGSRLALLTSAGDPAHWSYRKLQEFRRRDAWYVNEVPGPCPWIDPAELAEQEFMLSESEYAQLHLNRWTAAEDRLVTPEMLADAMTLDGPQEPVVGVRYVVGVDLGLVNDRTVVAVCHAEAISSPAGRFADGRPRSAAVANRVVLDRMMVWKGRRSAPVQLPEVEEAVVALAQRYRAVEIVLDPWNSAQMDQLLARRGLPTVSFSFGPTSVGHLGQTLFTLARNRCLVLPRDDELADELLNLRLRQIGHGSYRIDHDPGRHDDRAVAIALCAHELLTRHQAPVTQMRRADYPNTAEGRIDREMDALDRRRRVAPIHDVLGAGV